MRRLLIAAALVLGTVAGAFAAPVATVNTNIGKVLAGDNGMTLYVLKKAGSNVSESFNSCSELWPPLMAKPGAE